VKFSRDAQRAPLRVAAKLHGDFFRRVRRGRMPSNFRQASRTRLAQRKAAIAWRLLALSPG
jgi:hypothetical protein